MGRAGFEHEKLVFVRHYRSHPPLQIYMGLLTPTRLALQDSFRATRSDRFA